MIKKKKKNKHQIFPWLLLYLVKDQMNATRGIGKKKYNPNFPTRPDNLTLTPLTMSMSDGAVQNSHYFQVKMHKVNPTASLFSICLPLLGSHCLLAWSCRMYEMGPGILSSDRLWGPPSSARHKGGKFRCSSNPSDAKSLPKFQSRNACAFLEWKPNKLMIRGIKATTTMFK